MRPDLPFPEDLDLTPGPDGYRLWFRGHLIWSGRTESNAIRAMIYARQAKAMLEALHPHRAGHAEGHPAAEALIAGRITHLKVAQGAAGTTEGARS